MQITKRMTSLILILFLFILAGLALSITNVSATTTTPLEINSIDYDAKEETAKITWKNDETATGYQIVFSYERDFKSSEKVIVEGTTATLKKLQSGKTLYVKVRPFNEDGEKKIYGNYSSIESSTLTNTATETTKHTIPPPKPITPEEKTPLSVFKSVLITLGNGFLKTLELFLYTLLGALPLGLIIAFGSMSKFFPLKSLTKTFVWIIRGTPLMLQLIIIYYGPGIAGFRIWGTSNTGRLLATVIAFVINYACYFSEIYRGGIESISKGQYEAGQVLGMTKSQIFFKVVLVQVIKRIIPPMSNETITLVKDTSLARIIAVYELTFKGEAFSKDEGIVWPLFFTGVFYLVFSGLLTILFNRFEKKLSYFN